MGQIGYKKSVDSDYCRSTIRGSRIAFPIKRQREAHAEYKIYSRATIVKVPLATESIAPVAFLIQL